MHMSTARLLVLVAATFGVVASARVAVSPRDSFAQRLMMTCAALLLWGQLANSEGLLYPLVSWNMYTTTRAPRAYHRFVITTPERAAHDYPMNLIAPLSPGPLGGYSMLTPVTLRLVRRQSICRCDSGDPELDSLIASLAHIYELRRKRYVLRFDIQRIETELVRHVADPRTIYSWQPYIASPGN
jgi:hypothetical protein